MFRLNLKLTLKNSVKIMLWMFRFYNQQFLLVKPDLSRLKAHRPILEWKVLIMLE
jgi:hypothetical protein